MKSATEYLVAQVSQVRRSRRDQQPMVAYSAAIQAIEAALADAEKYKYLLMRALRHHVDATTEVPLVTPASTFPPLLPPALGSVLFQQPNPERLAA